MFYDRFIELCAAKGVSRTKACIDCGVSRTAWHKWEDGGTPNGATMSRLSNYFGVSVGYLLGTEEEKVPVKASDRQIDDADLMFALWGDTDEVTEEDLEDVRRYAAFVRERKQKK